LELLEKETLGKEEIAKIFTDVRGPKSRGAWTGSAARKPSHLPPVDVPVRIATEETRAEAEKEAKVEKKEDEKPKRRAKKAAPKGE
jgi:cell division protease FtsH